MTASIFNTGVKHTCAFLSCICRNKSNADETTFENPVAEDAEKGKKNKKNDSDDSKKSKGKKKKKAK